MPVYLAFEGPVMLCFGNQLLEGHGITYHKDGFGSPVGKIKGISGLIETMSEGELAENRIIIGDILNLEFNSGVKVTGRLEKITSQLGRNLLFSFQDCTVTYKGNVFFRPEWGVFDMAVGESIISCFSGPANPDAFGLRYPAPLEKTHHIIHTDKTVRLFSLYSRVRAEREKGSDPSVLEDTWQILKLEYPEEWLLPLEIAEELVTKYNNTDSADEIIAHIIGMAGNKEDILTLIRDGLSLIRHQP